MFANNSITNAFDDMLTQLFHITECMILIDLRYPFVAHWAALSERIVSSHVLLDVYMLLG